VSGRGGDEQRSERDGETTHDVTPPLGPTCVRS